MSKLFLLLFFAFSLLSNFEDRKKEKKSTHDSETELNDNPIPHDSLLARAQNTSQIIKQRENVPIQKNNSI